tara:strand:- start:668 stop:967 length:300 start_codon:yes stop_codon:yes gene_type:complete
MAKQQIFPGEWAQGPKDHRAIFELLRVGAGTRLTPDNTIEIDPDIVGSYAVTRDTEIRPGIRGRLSIDTFPLGELLDRWHAGERWVPVAYQLDLFAEGA